MMFLNAVILGIVEGITEFLPISSTAHLIVASKLLGIPQTDFQKFFEVFIQAGAILAVVFLYTQYVGSHRQLLKNIAFSFIPTAIAGLIFYKLIKNVFFESVLLVTIALFVVGLVFFLVEDLIKKGKIKIERSITNISWQEAIIIGLGQALAVVPGVSRAGAVIVTMLLMGYRREQAAVYSFLLAVPTILAASFFDLYKMRNVIMDSRGMIGYLFVGLVASFVTALFSVRWLVSYLKNHTLVIFGIYRILLAIILILAFLITTIY